MELVQLTQPVKLPSLLICNMLPLNSKGSKILSRINAEKKIRVYTIKGDYQIYTLSSCLVGGLIQRRAVIWLPLNYNELFNKLLKSIYIDL